MEQAPTFELPTPVAGAASPGGTARGPALQRGAIFAERFQVEGLCGRGGMGTVYRALDQRDARPVALKVLHPEIAADAEGLERFQREALLLSRVRHPAIPSVFELVMTPVPYLVVEFVDGCTLKEELARRGVLPVAEAVALTVTLAGALQAAHEHGIVHRDVKPSNVMLARDGSVKLLDFGIARSVAFDAKTITRTGMVLGTPEYMSPEQLISHRVDARSDVYSLGVLLFELVTGEPPFVADTPFGVALKHKAEPAPPARERNRQVPAWLERAILRCMAKDKEARYATAAELAADLSRSRSAIHRRTLPTGDAVIEDEGGGTDWALRLFSPREKPGWSIGMALSYEGRYYRLDEILPPLAQEGWMYHLSFWPTSDVFRQVVDYAAYCADRKAQEDSALGAKLRRLFRS